MKAIKAAFITAMIIGVIIWWPLIFIAGGIGIVYWFVYMTLSQENNPKE